LNPHVPAPKEESALTLNRRDWLKLVGGGIIVFIYPAELAQAQDRLPSSYLRVGPDGLVTLFTPKIEMGQGIITSLAQMAAEELDLPLSSMRAIMGDTAQGVTDPDGGTWGSLTTRGAFGSGLRTAAARARAVLVTLASQELSVPRDRLVTKDGYVIDSANEQTRVSYATLAGGKNIEAHLDFTPRPKAFAQFTVSGKPALRVDAIEKVTGRAMYTADIRLPGMVYARILRPPAHGAKLTSVDTAAAEQLPGVTVKQVGTFWAVWAEDPELANRALALLKPVWDLPAAGPDEETIFAYLMGRYPSAQTVGQRGSLTTGEQASSAKFEQTYYTPYVAHAPIEPHAAVVTIENGKVRVWASTQRPFAVRDSVASALSVSSANVQVITPFVGGGFGGKSSFSQAVEAARIARAAGKPVSLAWTREEEFFYDAFQPPSVTKIRSGLDGKGKITFWDYQVYCVGDRGAALFYEIPNSRVRPWRGPGNPANTFARESHIDAMAAHAAIDPLEFRLAHLRNTRMRKVLEKAAALFGWQPARLPSGRGYGMACGEDAGTYVAMIAAVEVDHQTGEIKVKRIVCAQDMGQVINPQGARLQMEGCMMMGLGYSLTEEMHFKNGRLLDLNFHRYQIPRFSWMPQLETALVENNTLSPQGGGEPAIITVGAALANALFDAVGVRANRLPMTPERVLALMQIAPTLAVQPPVRVGDQVRVSWNGGPGIKLQKCAHMPPTGWQDVAGTEGQTSITLPLSDQSAYFRVIKP
jgi:nicotinate dehydrogenase subunit B